MVKSNSRVLFRSGTKVILTPAPENKGTGSVYLPTHPFNDHVADVCLLFIVFSLKHRTLRQNGV